MTKTVRKPKRRAKAVSKKPSKVKLSQDGQLGHRSGKGDLPYPRGDFDKLPAAFQNAPPRADGTAEGINGSQLNEHMRCPWRWELKNRRLIDRRSIAPPMDLGSAVHAGVAGAIHTFALIENPAKATKVERAGVLQALVVGVREWRNQWMAEHCADGRLADETETQLSEIQVKAVQIAERALEEIDLPRYEVVWYKGEPLVERKITIPFLPSIPFYGTPDVVWKDRQSPKNSIMPWDFKVREKMQAVEHEEVDLQLPAYQYMLGKLDIPTIGAGKFQIRAELPRIPERNKNGAMSRQRIATTWDMYKAELIRYGLKPADYEEEMKQKLDVEFFRLDQLYRNQFEIQSFWDNIITPLGKQLVEAKEFIRHMHFINCTGCWARELCLSELRGEDTGFLLETNYIDLRDPKAKLVLRPEDVTIEVE